MIQPAPTLGSVFDGVRIGLLGGSFNPAHEGHLAMSRYALRRLKLDQVWWLVSPQNPLKSLKDMAPLEQRVKQARALAKQVPRLFVNAIEADLGTQYTIDTIQALQKRMPGARFVWLMGADNLGQCHLWRRWEEIFQTVPIAVFRRPGYASAQTASKASRRFAAARLGIEAADRLASSGPPAWLVLDNPLNPLSATQKRRRQQQNAKNVKDRDRGDEKKTGRKTKSARAQNTKNKKNIRHGG